MGLNDLQTLEKSADSLRNGIIDVLQKLVSIPSITGDEGQTQEFMWQNYDALGVDVRILYEDAG